MSTLSITALICITTLGQAPSEQPRNGPKEQYKTLLEEFEKANSAWQLSKPRITMEDPSWPAHYAAWPIWTYGTRFIQYAEAHPKEPEAVDALLQVVQFTKTGRANDIHVSQSVKTAVHMLTNDHLKDERVINTCLPIASRWGYFLETYARALMAANTNKEIVARSCLAVWSGNNVRLAGAARPSFEQAEDVTGQLRISAEFVISRLDPEYITYIKQTDSSTILSESEKLLERLLNELGDVELSPKWIRVQPGIQTIADYVRPKYEAMRNLAVGKLAPDIEGEDIDGKPMKLTDYRGKVVVLVFWGTWCGPCMRSLPLEKAIVSRLKDKPFILLGINSDADKNKLKQTIAKESITWGSWWDGGKIGGPIATRWDVQGWPTIIVLDKQGVIRFKNLPHYTPKPLNDAVDSLIAQ
jgi:thiol-disulfide isomerase/thioredoxin